MPDLYDANEDLDRTLLSEEVAEQVRKKPRGSAEDYTDSRKLAALQSGMEDRRVPGDPIDTGWIYEWLPAELLEGEMRERLNITRRWTKNGIPYVAGSSWHTGTVRSRISRLRVQRTVLTRTDVIVLASLRAVAHGPEVER